MSGCGESTLLHELAVRRHFLQKRLRRRCGAAHLERQVIGEQLAYPSCEE
jgi:hypothetical protein